VKHVLTPKLICTETFMLFARWKLYRVAKSAFDHCAEIYVTEYPSALGSKISEFTWIRAQEKQPFSHLEARCDFALLHANTYVYALLHITWNIRVTMSQYVDILCFYVYYVYFICVVLIIKCYHFCASPKIVKCYHLCFFILVFENQVRYVLM